MFFTYVWTKHWLSGLPGTYLESIWIHSNSTLDQLRKHLENTWNIPGIHMDPLKFHPSSTPGSSWKTSGKHLEHTWNPHGSTQIPPKFHPGSSWKTPGKHLESIWVHPNSIQVPPWTNSSVSLECTWNVPGTSMDYLDSTWNPTAHSHYMWNILEFHGTSSEYVEPMWIPCEKVGECKLLYQPQITEIRKLAQNPVEKNQMDTFALF